MERAMMLMVVMARAMMAMDVVAHSNSTNALYFLLFGTMTISWEEFDQQMKLQDISQTAHLSHCASTFGTCTTLLTSSSICWIIDTMAFTHMYPFLSYSFTPFT